MSQNDFKPYVKCFTNSIRKQILEQKFSSDVTESLEVAVQCLEAAYEISSSVEDAEMSSTGNAADNIDLYELFRTAGIDVTEDRKQKAEEIKNEGNRLMKEGKFDEAVNYYDKAISLDATNSVFYCNRAAARLRLQDFKRALVDCQMSLVYNPNYGKAYGRMGLAYSNLQKFDKAVEAYKKAVELEPENEDYQHNLKNAEMDLNTPLPNFRNRISNIVSELLGHSAIDRNASANQDEIVQLTNDFMTEMRNQYPDIFHQFLNMRRLLNQPNSESSPPNPMRED